MRTTRKCNRCGAFVPPWLFMYEITIWNRDGSIGHSDGKLYCGPCAKILTE